MGLALAVQPGADVADALRRRHVANRDDFSLQQQRGARCGDGPAPTAGDDGADGTAGSRGFSGRYGKSGDLGRAGNDGQSGSAGQAGQPGKNGNKGKED